jgi:hypothetical protein
METGFLEVFVPDWENILLQCEEDLMHNPVQTVSSADSYKNRRCGLFF